MTPVVLRIAFTAGLVLRLLVFWQTADLDTGIVDEQHYRAIATNVLTRHEFAATAGQPTSIRPPLYPALVAGIWSVSGLDNLQAVRLVQILLALVTTWITYELGRQVFDDRTAAVGAAIAWLYPTLIFFNFLILTETLFTCLLMAFVLLAVRLVKTPTATVAAGCGLSLGLAALARSVLWPLPIVLCPLLVLLMRGPLPRRIGYALLLLGGYLAAITPWAVRNTRLQETVTIVDTMGGINLRMGNYEYTPDDRMWDAVSVSGDRSWVRGFSVPPGVNPTEGRKDKWAQAKAVEYMRAHPAQTLRRSLIKFADFWGLEREFIAGVQERLFTPPQGLAIVAAAAMAMAYVVVALGAAAGIWVAPPADWRLHVLLLLPVAVTTAAHTIVFGHSRYHLPLIPILGLYAAHLATRWQEVRLPAMRPVVVGAGVSILTLATIWFRQLAFSDAQRIGALLRWITG